MTNKPVVSILVTTYNRSHLLRRAINSVLMQDYSDFEIVIIDDCSSDNTADVVASFRDPRIRYVKNDVNVGSKLGDRAHVQKFVYQLMRGKYFVYLCDDDYWLPPDLLRRQIAFFDGHDNLAFVTGNQLSHFVTTSDSYFGHSEQNPPAFTPETIKPYFEFKTQTCKSPHFSFFPQLFSSPFLKSEDFLREFAAQPTSKNLIVGATLYSREHFVRAGAMRADGSKWQAGYEFLMGPACVGNVGYLDEPCIVTEIRSTNASFQRTQAEHYLDSVKSVETAFQAPLSDPRLMEQRKHLVQAKASAIRNLSIEFQSNSIAILRDGSLSLCSAENMRRPVAIWHILPVLWRNRILPTAAMLSLCLRYLVHKSTEGALFHDRRRESWMALRRRISAAIHSGNGKIQSAMGGKHFKYKDRLFPNQEFYSHLYQDKAPLDTAIFNSISAYARDFDSSRFQLKTAKNTDFEQMSTPPGQLALVHALIKLRGAKTVLEIGTFVGHSSMQFAQMVGEGGHVTTIEIGEEFAEIARDNFRRNGFESRITLLQGNAGQILEELKPNSFDLAFVDGSKQDYLQFTLSVEKLLSERGVIVIDDVFFHGDALNLEPSTEKGRGCKQLLSYFENCDRFERLLLPIANGVLILFKTSEAARGGRDRPS